MIIAPRQAILVQGIDSVAGRRCALRMQAAGSLVVGGTGAGGTDAGAKLPVWRSVHEAVSSCLIDLCVVATPPLSTREAALEALDAGIRQLVIVSGHVPVQDVMYILAMAEDLEARVLGPGSAGTACAGASFVGALCGLDAAALAPGGIAVITRSGSLGILVAAWLKRAGWPLTALIDLGGAPMIGIGVAKAVKAALDHEACNAILLAATFDQDRQEEPCEAQGRSAKPVIAYMAGAISRPGGATSNPPTEASPAGDDGITRINALSALPATLKVLF